MATLVLGTGAAMPVFSQDGGAAEQAVEIVRTGIPHDALYALDMSGEWGLAVGNFGLMLQTADGGATWEMQKPVTKLALLGVTRANKRQLVVGQQGLVMTRADGGEWSVVDTGFSQRLLNVDMNEAGLAFTIGEFGFVARSRDYGASWEEITLDWSQYNDEGYEPHLYDAIVENDGTVFIAGEFGLILRSTDGGDSWEVVHQGEASVFEMEFANDGGSTGYAVGQEGLVLRTADRGMSWQTIEVDTNSNLLGVWSGNGEVVITGIRQMLRSSDDGASFSTTDDLQVVRTWFQGVDAGVAETKTGEKGFLREQSVYTVGFQGTVARVVK
ncbi:MAG: YCF48-related protein [Gammaproteobacteria bacterium]